MAYVAGDYAVFPTDTLATITTTLFQVIADNVTVLVAIVALAIGVVFVMRWFNKSHKKIKA